MTSKALQKLQTSNTDLSRVQDNVDTALRALGMGVNSGQQLKSVTLVAGTNSVNHGLGRVLQGWFFVRFRGQPGQIFDTQDANPTPDKTLLLTSPAGVIVDIWVF